MTKIQKIKLKFLLIFSIITILGIQQAQAQVNKPLLKSADSLFLRKKYTESFDLYAKIMEQGRVSPTMLLKMAFIKEGLGDVTGALYFLNLYYIQTSNEAVLTKMEEIAKKHKLTGYEYTDADYFLTFYRQYRSQIIYGSMAFALLIFTLMILQQRKTGKKPVWAGALFILILLNILFFINFSESYHKGIIRQQSAYLMRGPSAGSGVLEVVKNGHRVDVTGRKDVWVEIAWKGTVAYIKEDQIVIVKD